MSDTTIPDTAMTVFVDALDKANVRAAAQFPGDSAARQPVHTVYGGAHLFKARHGAEARRARAACARGVRARRGDVRARRSASIRALAGAVYERVVEKLTREPVEDFRIDFEDGYGNRPDAEEDGHAAAAARRSGRRACSNGTLPPFIGIRIKPFPRS